MFEGRLARVFCASVVLTLAFSGLANAQLADKVADRLWDSAKILDEVTRAPDGGIPSELLKRAWNLTKQAIAA